MWRISSNGQAARIKNIAGETVESDVVVAPCSGFVKVVVWGGSSGWAIAGYFRTPDDWNELYEVLKERPSAQLETLQALLGEWFRLERISEAITEPVTEPLARFYKGLPTPRAHVPGWNVEAGLKFARWLYERGRLSDWWEVDTAVALAG